MIQQALSGLVALQLGAWQREHGVAAASPRVSIEPAELLRRVRTIHRVASRDRQLVQGLPNLALSYERDLADPGAWTASGARICEHLGVDPAPLAPKVARLYDEPYSRIVVNFDEAVDAVPSELRRLGPRA